MNRQARRILNEEASPPAMSTPKYTPPAVPLPQNMGMKGTATLGKELTKEDEIVRLVGVGAWDGSAWPGKHAGRTKEEDDEETKRRKGERDEKEGFRGGVYTPPGGVQVVR